MELLEQALLKVKNKFQALKTLKYAIQILPQLLSMLCNGVMDIRRPNVIFLQYR